MSKMNAAFKKFKSPRCASASNRARQLVKSDRENLDDTDLIFARNNSLSGQKRSFF